MSDPNTASSNRSLDLTQVLEEEYARVHGGKPGKYCAIGRIEYNCVDAGAENGVLIYLKPAFYGNSGGSEPRDIYHYALSHENFPHESTGDQFFGEAQFESYRMLGSHAADQIMSRGEELDIDDLIVLAYEHSGKKLAWLEESLSRRGVNFTPLP